MRSIPAKVGSVPMVIDIKGKRVLREGDRVQWRRHFVHGDKWSPARVLRVDGPADRPEHVLLERF